MKKELVVRVLEMRGALLVLGAAAFMAIQQLEIDELWTTIAILMMASAHEATKPDRHSSRRAWALPRNSDCWFDSDAQAPWFSNQQFVDIFHCLSRNWHLTSKERQQGSAILCLFVSALPSVSTDLQLDSHFEVYRGVMVWHFPHVVMRTVSPSDQTIFNSNLWPFPNRSQTKWWLQSMPIVLPDTSDSLQTFANEFKEKRGLENIVLAIDGTHIQFRRPSRTSLEYRNRKKYDSILLQGTVDSRKRFRDVFVGWPGSAHDTRVFKNSPLFHKWVTLINIGYVFITLVSSQNGERILEVQWLNGGRCASPVPGHWRLWVSSSGLSPRSSERNTCVVSQRSVFQLQTLVHSNGCWASFWAIEGEMELPDFYEMCTASQDWRSVNGSVNGGLVTLSHF